MRKWVLVCRAVTVEGKVHMMSHTSSHQARPLPVTLSMWSLKAASSPQVASRFNTTPPPQSHTCVCTWHYASSRTIQARTHSGYWYRPTRGRCWWCVDTEGVQQHLSLNEFSFKCDVKKTPGSSAAFRGGWSPRYPVTHTHTQRRITERNIGSRNIQPCIRYKLAAWLGIITTDYTVMQI